MNLTTLERAQQLTRFRSVTPDGRFVIDIRTQVPDIGPADASAHELNEHIEIDTIDALKSTYQQVHERLLPPA
jgi:succinyl-diaminopimelate desuccinylase